MKCNSCTEEISPKFTAAIAANSCPFCGSEIMSQKLRDILTALREIFTEATDYMEQVEDWLDQNFGLKKVGEDQIVVDKAKLANSQTFNFPNTMGKNSFAIKRSDEEGGDLKHYQHQNIFAHRAGIKEIKAKKDIAYIMSQNGGAADASEFVGVDEEGEDVSLDERPLTPLPKTAFTGQNPLEGVFGSPDPVLELEKVKRLQRQDMSALGGVAKINRKDE